MEKNEGEWTRKVDFKKVEILGSSRRCTQDLTYSRLYTVSVRPYYLPREFLHVFVTHVYVSPHANAKDAANVISSHMHDLETSAPDAFKINTGDFNHCSLKTSTMNYFQHDRTLDQC